MAVSLKWITKTKGTVNLVQNIYTSGWPTTSENTNNYVSACLHGILQVNKPWPEEATS